MLCCVMLCCAVLARHTLRPGGGSSKVCGLTAFPDEDSSTGQDGMVVWAADGGLNMTLPSSQVKGGGGGGVTSWLACGNGKKRRM